MGASNKKSVAPYMDPKRIQDPSYKDYKIVPPQIGPQISRKSQVDLYGSRVPRSASWTLKEGRLKRGEGGRLPRRAKQIPVHPELA